MANEVVYNNRLYIDSAYNPFKLNRKNVISSPISSNDKLKVYVNESTAYAYASSSSAPLLNDSPTSISLKVNNSTSYNFYVKHSYTYTENVYSDNFKAFIIAYDYVKGKNGGFTTITSNPKVFHQAAPVGSQINIHVNTYSGTSYMITSVNIDSTLNSGIDMPTQIELTDTRLMQLLGNNNYVDCSTYVNYSYIKQNTPRDGKVYTNGHKLIKDNRDIYVWSLINGYDRIPLLTTDGNSCINAYVYMKLGKKIERDGLITEKTKIDTDYHFQPKYDYSGGFTPVWKIVKNVNKYYIQDAGPIDGGGQRYRDFISHIKPYNLPVSGHENASFSEVSEHPTWRDNIGFADFYQNIKVISNGKNNSTIVNCIDTNNNIKNYNTAKYIKRIGKLPISILNKTTHVVLSGIAGEILGGLSGHGSDAGTLFDDITITLMKSDNTSDYIKVSFNYAKLNVCYRDVEVSTAGWETLTITDMYFSDSDINNINYTLTDNNGNQNTFKITNFSRIISPKNGTNDNESQSYAAIEFDFEIINDNIIDHKYDQLAIAVTSSAFEYGGLDMKGKFVEHVNDNTLENVRETSGNYEYYELCQKLNNNVYGIDSIFIEADLQYDGDDTPPGGNDGPEPEQDPLYYLSTNSGEIEYVYTQDLSSGDPTNADFLVTSIRTTSPAHIKYTYPNNSTSTGTATVMTLDHDSIELGGGRTLNWHVRDAQTGIPINNYGTSLYDYQLQLNKEYTMDISWNASSTSEYIRYSNKDGETTFAGPAQSISCSYIVAQQTKNTNIAFTTRN